MKDKAATAESNRRLVKPEVCERLGGIDPGTLARHVRDGRFPPPAYIFGKATWLLSDVLRWEAANIQATPPAKVKNLRHAKDSP